MKAHEMVAKARNLKPVSHTALRLVSLLGRQDGDNTDLVEALKCDNVLTAKLLRLCNSPTLALAEPVASIDQAVLVLGHNQILQMVLNIAFGSTMAVALPGYAVQSNELWEHSLVAATAAQVAASRCPELDADPAVAFTVGLLHDIGKLVMNEVLTKDVQAAIRERIANDGLSRVEAEKRITGTDHAEVGSCLLYVWRLPEVIIEAVANHHQPVLQPHPRLSALAHLANCLAHLAGSAPGWEAYALRAGDETATVLNLTEGTVDALIVGVRDALEKSSQMMKMV